MAFCLAVSFIVLFFLGMLVVANLLDDRDRRGRRRRGKKHHAHGKRRDRDLDRVVFAVDDETYERFVAALAGAAVPNKRLKKLLRRVPAWKRNKNDGAN